MRVRVGRGGVGENEGRVRSGWELGRGEEGWVRVRVE